MLEKYFIVRSSGLYGVAGSLGKGKTNFVENMINKAKNKAELKVVTDEILTPTYTLDLAGKINELLRTSTFGLYHVTNSGQCSWHEFACRIFEFLEMRVVIQKIAADQFKTKARRPKYSVLAHGGLKKLGMDNLRPWQEALRAYLIEKGHLKPR
jgi:dTDP-4-dehydrorhamnose reductase